ncbi:MAG: MFS transporter [Clostridiaceae bacterium]|nr:MFS transporter [Clostridiaceae bacterium]
MIQQKIEQELQPYIKRNVSTSIVDGILNATAMGLIPLQTLVIYFISEYVHSNLVIGLLTTVQTLMTAIPQFFSARLMERIDSYKGLMGKYVFIYRTSHLLIGLLVLFLAPRKPLLFTILFYIIFWLNGLFMGMGNSVYFNFINKVIPFNIRGKFFGWRGALNSVGGVLGSLLAGVILRRSVSGTQPYGYLFLLAFTLDMISFFFLVAAYEPKNSQVKIARSQGYGNRLMEILKRDKNIIRFITAQALIVFPVVSLFPFQTVYAKSSFNIGADTISAMNTIMFVCKSIGFIIWGMLVQRRGFKWSMLCGYLLFIINLVSAIFIKNPDVVFVLTAVFGLTHSAFMIGNINIIFGMCPYEDRPAYLCIANIFIIPMSAIAPLVNGYIYDVFGFRVMCIINLILLLGGIVRFTGVKEPYQVPRLRRR